MAGLAIPADLLPPWTMKRYCLPTAGQADKLRASLDADVVLDAVVAAHTPQIMGIWDARLKLDGPYELRIIRGADENFRRVLIAYALAPILWDASNDAICLIPVTSLAERAERWNAFHSGPEWLAIGPQCRTTHISVWKTV
jgi:hypothetical protein